MSARNLCFSLITCLLSALILSSPVRAQTVDPDILTAPVGESGAAYERAKRFRGIEGELIYLRDEADPKTYWNKKAKTGKTYSPQRTGTAGAWSGTRLIMIAVSLAVLIAICMFAVKFAPNAVFNRASPSDDRRRGAAGNRTGERRSDTGAGATGAGEFLARLQAMADRREAIILLLKRCLELALEANNMALGRSQTAREILYRLPGTWLHFEALARIVRIEERVQFRGEDLPETVFQESLELAKPMFGLGKAAQ